MKTIILYGMRATGKSTIGRVLAKELGYNFLDLDNFITEKKNKALPDYIEAVGWDEFRDEEYRCLKEVSVGYESIHSLQGKAGRVISLGGGTIAFERNRKELFQDKNTKIIYLDTHIEEIARRISKDENSGEKRNSLTGKSVLDELKEVYKQREAIYKNNCDFSVDNNGSIEKTVAEIAYKLTWGGICIPITDVSNIFEIYHDIRSDRKIEYVELRLDLMFTKQVGTKYILCLQDNLLKSIIQKCPKKIICTLRHENEGGKFCGTAEDQVQILQKCLNMGVQYVDIELQNYKKLSSNNRLVITMEKLIFSYHNFKCTPSYRELQNVLQEMKEFSPAVYKIACMPERYEDVEKMYELHEYFNKNFGREKPVFISMGGVGLQLRIDSPRMGGLFSFGSFGENTSAPGQIDYKELYNSIYNQKKIFGKSLDFYENFTVECSVSNGLGAEGFTPLTNKRVLFLGREQISGSFSPFMHNFSSNLLKREENKFFYTLTPVSAEYNSTVFGWEEIAQEFVEFLESGNRFLGGNVTMPYKIDMYNYLKERNSLDKNALLVGAVNTLYKKDGKIRGTNTDIEGISLPIQEKLGDISKIKNCYILGAGGAARSAIGAMIGLGIKNIYIFNRSQKNLDEIAKHFKVFLGENQQIITTIYDVQKGDVFSLPLGEKSNKQRGLIINTLPFGFKKNLPESPIDFKDLSDLLPHIALYFEAVYDAEYGDTPLVQEIEKQSNSLSTEGFSPLKNRDNQKVYICRGAEMLIAQAKNGFELWSEGGKFQTQKIKDILLK